jgi:Family of unknown function (DUF5977)
MSVIKQPFQFLKFSKSLSNQLRFQEGYNNDLCDIPVIPKGKFIPFGIISGSNVIGDINLLCHNENLFFNTEASQYFTKNDCPGVAGEGVPYIVKAKKYHSAVSQEDANQKAFDEITANGQSYANDYGTCAGVYFRDDFNEVGGWQAVEYQGTTNMSIENGKIRLIFTNMGSGGSFFYLPNIIKGNAIGKSFRLKIKIDEFTVTGNFEHDVRAYLGFIDEPGWEEIDFNHAVGIGTFEATLQNINRPYEGFGLFFQVVQSVSPNASLLIDFIELAEL